MPRRETLRGRPTARWSGRWCRRGRSRTGSAGCSRSPGRSSVPGSWSKNLGWSPSSDGAPALNCHAGAVLGDSDGQLTGSLPLGLTLPKSTSATAGAALGACPVGHQQRRRRRRPGRAPSGPPGDHHDDHRLAGRLQRGDQRLSGRRAESGAGLSPRPSAYAFSPTATTHGVGRAPPRQRPSAWSGAADDVGGRHRRLMPSSTVVPGGIWLGGPMQQLRGRPLKTPCQLTLQPPSWLAIESALGPVTTILPRSAPAAACCSGCAAG